VIIGAGSNGLYAALRLFLAGTRVTVVNMYKEFYMRNQFFFLDPKWVCQLRYFLGTKFDELFGPCGNGFGRVNRGHVGQVNARNFEQALKERIVSLANIVEVVNLNFYIYKNISASENNQEVLKNIKILWDQIRF
jgi:hypothetical protein